MRPGLVAVLILTGCVTRTTVDQSTRRLESILEEHNANARSCSPVELGQAEATIEFSRFASMQGDPVAAKMHLTSAQRLVAIVVQKSQGAACEGDRDGDGLADTIDKCPDIPEDFDGDEDKDGCPDFDRDGDGIPDDRDRCPNNKEDKDGFQDTDGCPEFDNDRDGLIDTSDQCPNKPEDFDGFQDLDGCPDDDNDGDGIPDEIDKCPNRAGPAQSGGCPDSYKFILLREKRIDLKRPILFKPGTAKLLPKSHAVLNEIVAALNRMPSVAIRIEGHTDAQGAASDNQRRTQRQANAVRKYLTRKGISGKRLAAVGHGEDRPIDENDTDEGRATNRRIEFHIVR